MMWMRDKAEIYELSSSCACDMCVEDVSMCFERESVVDLEERKHGKLSPPFNTPPPTHPHPHKQNVRG